MMKLKIFSMLVLFMLSVNIVHATILDYQDGREKLLDITSKLTDNLGSCDQNFKVHTQLSSVIKNKANSLTSGISDKYKKAERLFNYVRDIPYPTGEDLVCIGDGSICGYRWSYPEEIINKEYNTADCKTKSALLVSLLRVSGFSEKEVFMVSSYSESHQYVIIKYKDNNWLILDPTWLKNFYVMDGKGDVLEPSNLGNDIYLYDSRCSGNVNVNKEEKPIDLCENIICNDKCVGDYLYENGICVGGKCEYTKEYCSKGCSNSKCDTYQEFGESCGFSSDCKSGYTCSWSGKCLKNIGQSCSSDSQCAYGICNRGICDWGSIHCYEEGHDCRYDSECCGDSCQEVRTPDFRVEWQCRTGNQCLSNSDCKWCDGTVGYVAECSYHHGNNYKSCDWINAENNYCKEGCIDNNKYSSGCKDGGCIINNCPENTKCEYGKCVLIEEQKPILPPPDVIERKIFTDYIKDFFNWILTLFGFKEDVDIDMVSCKSNQLMVRKYCPPSENCDIDIKCVYESELKDECYLIYDTDGNSQEKCYGNYKKIETFNEVN